MTTSSARRLPLLVAFAVALLVAACGTSAGASPTPAPTSTPVPTPSTVESAEAAWARVLGVEPRFGGMAARDRDLIGQSAWHEIVADGTAWSVSVFIGWGDCMAGCIDRHVWVYSVAHDGTVTAVSDQGPAVPDSAWTSPSGSGKTGIYVTAWAGPVCPVVRPGEPGCAPRLVAGATVVIRDAAGTEVARSATDETGHAFIELPAGAYLVEAGPVEGLMGTPGAFEIDVPPAGEAVATLDYDTGIR